MAINSLVGTCGDLVLPGPHHFPDHQGIWPTVSQDEALSLLHYSVWTLPPHNVTKYFSIQKFCLGGWEWE